MIREFAPAKINLFLHVDPPDGSGYHPLRSLVAFADIGDELLFAPSDGFGLSINGPFGRDLQPDGSNLVLRAARALAEECGGAGAHITLTKNLPVSSGIGGGSADAAATLRGLNQLWDCGLAETDLVRLGAKIGSDVPVCVGSAIAIMEGRGDYLRLARPETIYGVLVNPGISVSTRDVFAAYDKGVHDGVHGLGKPCPALRDERNDLMPAAVSLAPIIADVLQALRDMGADWVRMCGSGATCLGAFADASQAQEAAVILMAKYPKWWICHSHIH